jgi:hypothetical protein
VAQRQRGRREDGGRRTGIPLARKDVEDDIGGVDALRDRFSTGGLQPVDLDVFTRAASHLRRMLESLGLKRTPREVETLEQYLANLPYAEGPRAADERASESDKTGGGPKPPPADAPASERPRAAVESSP